MAIDVNITRRIRNLIPDTDAIFGEFLDSYIFDAQAIEDFYTDGNSNVKWAAGLAMIALSTSEAYISKKIKNYETATDGSVIAKEIRLNGLALIADGKAELAKLDLDYFDIFYFNQDTVYMEGQTRPVWSL